MIPGVKEKEGIFMNFKNIFNKNSQTENSQRSSNSSSNKDNEKGTNPKNESVDQDMKIWTPRFTKE